MESSADYACRICLEDGKRKDFIAPCACKGSQRWVHRACLDQWRSTREDKAFSKCTECLKTYELICVTNDTWNEKCLRRTRFSFFITRDMIVSLFFVNIIVACFGSLTYVADRTNHSFIDSCKMGNVPFLFYYLIGWLFFFAFVGMIAALTKNNCSCSNNASSSADCLYCYYCPCTPTHTVAATDANTCCCVECGQVGMGCHGSDCPLCCELGNGVTLGEECAALLVVAVLIFAAIGLVASVWIGFQAMERSVRTHWHVLEKWNLTQEYLVKDLAPLGDSDEKEDGDSLKESEEDWLEQGGDGMQLLSRKQHNYMRITNQEGGEEEKNPSAPPFPSLTTMVHNPLQSQQQPYHSLANNQHNTGVKKGKTATAKGQGRHQNGVIQPVSMQRYDNNNEHNIITEEQAEDDEDEPGFQDDAPAAITSNAADATANAGTTTVSLTVNDVPYDEQAISRLSFTQRQELARLGLL